MTIGTLADLQAAIGNYVPDGPRTDLTGYYSDWLGFTQSKMYLGDDLSAQPSAYLGGSGAAPIPPLRIRQMIATGLITPSAAGTVSIASGVGATWLEFVELTPTYNWAQSIDYLAPWEFRKRVELSIGSNPALIYTIEGDVLTMWPPSISPVQATWYAKFAPLVNPTDTDWVLTNAPQIYLNGCIAEACAFLSDPAELSYRAKFAGGINALNSTDVRARSSGSVRIARPRSVA
jgi:hypothetical protein